MDNCIGFIVYFRVLSRDHFEVFRLVVFFLEKVEDDQQHVLDMNFIDILTSFEGTLFGSCWI